MPSVYHVDAPRVNTTPVCPSVPSVDFALVSSTLRRTFSTVYRLTARYGFCFASLARIAEYCSCSLSTVRKHIARLIREGMVRREEVPGYADRLFICPMAAWKNPPAVAQNGRTLHTGDASSLGSTKTTKQPAPHPAPPPVVVPTANAIETRSCPPVETVSILTQPAVSIPDEPEEPFGKTGAKLPIGQTTWEEVSMGDEDDQESIAALLVRSLDEAEGMLPSCEPPELPCAPAGDRTPEVTSPQPPDADENTSESAPRGPEQHVQHPIGTSQGGDRPVQVTGGCAPHPLTPEQEQTRQQLLQAGTAPRPADAMARRDSRKAQAVLKALRAALASGTKVPKPGGWLWACWNNAEFRAVERGEQQRGPVYAREAGLVVAPPADRFRVGVPDGAGREVLEMLRRKGFGTSAGA